MILNSDVNLQRIVRVKIGFLKKGLRNYHFVGRSYVSYFQIKIWRCIHPPVKCIKKLLWYKNIEEKNLAKSVGKAI